jgi:hypothetical protein
MEYLLKTAVVSERNLPKKEVMWASNEKTIGRVAQPVRSHITLLPALDARHGDTGFNVFPPGFQSCLVLIFPCYSLIPLF